jgi:hypothetical protein
MNAVIKYGFVILGLIVIWFCGYWYGYRKGEMKKDTRQEAEWKYI